jgi:hypothetical protein
MPKFADGHPKVGGRCKGTANKCTERERRLIAEGDDKAIVERVGRFDSIGSSTKSRVSHSERRPSAWFPGDKDGSARRNIEPLQ